MSRQVAGLRPVGAWRSSKRQPPPPYLGSIRDGATTSTKKTPSNSRGSTARRVDVRRGRRGRGAGGTWSWRSGGGKYVRPPTTAISHTTRSGGGVTPWPPRSPFPFATTSPSLRVFWPIRPFLQQLRDELLLICQVLLLDGELIEPLFQPLHLVGGTTERVRPAFAAVVATEVRAKRWQDHGEQRCGKAQHNEEHEEASQDEHVSHHFVGGRRTRELLPWTLPCVCVRVHPRAALRPGRPASAHPPPGRRGDRAVLSGTRMHRVKCGEAGPAPDRGGSPIGNHTIRTNHFDRLRLFGHYGIAARGWQN